MGKKKKRVKRLARFAVLAALLMALCLGLLPGCAVSEKSGDDESMITSFAKLDGKKVGLLTGSIYHDLLKKYVPGAIPVFFNNIADQVEALRSGKIFGILYDDPTAKEIINSTTGFAILDETLGYFDFGLITELNNVALMAQIDTIIEELNDSGKLQEMKDRWYGSDESKKVLPTLDFSETKGVLRAATNSIFPPMVYIKDNIFTGYEVELLMHIAHKLGRQLEISDMDFAAIIPAVTSGKAEIGFGMIGITPERKENVLFSQPTEQSSIRMIVKTADESERVSIETARVGVMTGSIGEMLMGKDYPKATISSFDTFSDAVAALSTGRLDYVLGSYTTMLNYVKHDKSLALLPENFSNEGNAIAVKKGNVVLREKIDAVLDKLKADGTLAEMEKRWIKADDTPYEVITLPKRENGEVLRVALSADREPICFVQDGQYVGFDCELAERVAYELGMRLEYQNMKFGGLISSLQTGKADIIISNLVYTEERAESVEFTQVYFNNPQILITRQDTASATKLSFFQSFADSFTKTFITENRYQLIFQGLGVTLLISFFSVIFGTALGFGICMLRRSKRKILSMPAGILIGVIQGTPIVVILMILFYLIFTNPNISPIIVAVVGFSINFAVYASEMMRAGIDAVDKGQIEAAVAIGFGTVQAFCKITLPQALRHVLPVFKGEFISMVKMTSVVGYIAIQDLTKMSDIIRSRTYEAFFPLISTALIYLLISYSIVFLLSRVEMKIDPKRRNRTLKGVVIK
ncbi:MAG: ABC transporter permease subunit [Clostridia bacterium]